MESILDAAAWICLLAGAFFAITGGIGLLRLPDFFCRIHGGGVTDTLGAGLILVGLMLHTWGGLADATLTLRFLVTAKLLMILFFLLVSSPTSAHAVARAAISHGLDPRPTDEGGGPSKP